MRLILIAIVLTSIPSFALGHTKFVSSFPEAGSTQSATLRQIDFAFDEPFVLAVIKLINESTGFNKMYRNKNTDRKTAHRVSIEPLPTGSFTLEWRGLAKDGHVISGTFEFSVKN